MTPYQCQKCENRREGKRIHHCLRTGMRLEIGRTCPMTKTILTEPPAEQVAPSGQYRWTPKQHDGMAVVTGCDHHQRELLEVMLKSYLRHNATPIYVADFGGLGAIPNRIDLTGLESGRGCMWLKPLAILAVPHQYVLWIDVDCLIHGDVSGVIEGFTAGMRARHDTPIYKIYSGDPSHIQAGILLFRHGESFVGTWADWCMSPEKRASIPDPHDIKDQTMLNVLVKQMGYQYQYLDHRYAHIRPEPFPQVPGEDFQYQTVPPIITHYFGTWKREMLAAIDP